MEKTLNKEDLHGYQLEAVRHILGHRRCALFLDMGLGKTAAALTAAEILLYEELEVSRVLVIAPKRVAETVWAEEAAKWGHLSRLRISVVAGNIKARKEALKRPADIYVIGRDNTDWLCWLYDYKGLPFDMLILDELSSFKNPRSKRFKSLRKSLGPVKRVVGLTGTPAPNGLLDLWAQIYLLDGGERLGRFVSNYRDKWFVPGARNGAVVYSYVPKAGAAEEIHKAVSDICLSMKAEDLLSLPGRIDNPVKVNLGPQLMKAYTDFERERVLELKGAEVTAPGAAALSLKLQQFANGFLYEGEGPERAAHEVHDLKIQACRELVEDAQGQPVLIAYNFIEDRERLLAALRPWGPRVLSGPRDIEDWNRGRAPVMLMHPASGGHGLNLQKGGHRIIWMGPTWSLELEQQFNARLDRQGQTEPVIINRLICAGTIDEDIMKALKAKGRTQDGLMEAVKSRMAKYFSDKKAAPEHPEGLF